MASVDDLWVVDFGRRTRVGGKSYRYFKLIETQEELDALLRADYERWVQSMKDAGAWNEE